MTFSEETDGEPLSGLIKYRPGSALDAVPFVGSLRKHPYDHEKCLLLRADTDPDGLYREGSVCEFRVADVLAADEVASPVDEQGAARALVRLWIRRGAIAVRCEPFEVGGLPKHASESRPPRSHLFHTHKDGKHGDAGSSP